MVKIYTKTGDKGETSLFGGKRVQKSSHRIEAIGSVDELNSVIGIIVSKIQNSKFKIQKHNSKIKSELIKIQNDLFEIGGTLASPSSKNPHFAKASRGKQELIIQYLGKRVDEFEEYIDEMTQQIPELKNFILPGGGNIGSHLHLARSIVRRAERRIVELSKKESVDKEILIYFNRFSDLLFTMARFVNYKQKEKETIWMKK